MSDKPILFSGPMVRALLAGTKTQTRRILKLKGHRSFTQFGPSDTAGYDWHFRDAAMRWHDLRNGEMLKRLRLAVGDRLYVREAWCDASSDAGPVICYRANYDRWQPPYTGPDEGAGPSFDYDRYPGKYAVWAADLEGTDKGWRPGIHQPKWASRLTLHVVEVRVQRLQDISEADARAEGIERLAVVGGTAFRDYSGGDGFNVNDPNSPARRSYRSLWDSINGRGSWETNPWVAAYTFDIELGNIEQARQAA